MIGDFTDVAPSAQALESVAQLIAWKTSNGYVDTTTTVTMVSRSKDNQKYPEGTSATVPVIFGHRDLFFTDCPGNQGYAPLAGPKYYAFGYPMTDENKSADGTGRYNAFTGDSNRVIISYHSRAGAHYVQGDITTKWADSGSMNGPLGYPITDWTPISGGSF